jgi:TM2 domain-containing membrane protein YozV
MLIPLPEASPRSYQTEPFGTIRPSATPKDPILMALLSGCCIAGLGQMVLGQTTKGVMILIGSVVLASVTFGATIILTWPLMGLDAYLIAKKLKEGRSVGAWECF